MLDRHVLLREKGREVDGESEAVDDGQVLGLEIVEPGRVEVEVARRAAAGTTRPRGTNGPGARVVRAAALRRAI